MIVSVNKLITNHLRMSEYQCNCRPNGYPYCTGGTIRAEAALRFEQFRAFLSHEAKQEVPLIVTSGVRCPAWNRRVGGVENGTHVQGRAIDILYPKTILEPLGIELRDFWRMATIVNALGGVGFYGWWEYDGLAVGGVHIDTLEDPPTRRWWEPQKRERLAGLPPLLERELWIA